MSHDAQQTAAIEMLTFKLHPFSSTQIIINLYQACMFQL